MKDIANSEVLYNIYEVTLLSNCYTEGIKVNVASLDIESAIDKAKKYLEQDVDNDGISSDLREVPISFQDAINRIKFADGSAFGVKVEGKEE